MLQISEGFHLNDKLTLIAKQTSFLMDSHGMALISHMENPPWSYSELKIYDINEKENVEYHGAIILLFKVI